MSRRFARSLVVGKFSPLHRGHELLLRSALERSERVFCISYSLPERPRCAAEARRRWFAELFPEIEHLAVDGATLASLRLGHPALPELPHDDASELEHRLFVAELCLRVFETTVDAVFTSERYGDGFAAELTRRFRAAGRGSQAPVEHVLVDLERQRVPISASALRGDPGLWQEFLAPIVRASQVLRVCLLGGESSGKTTLARLLAKEFQTTHAEEYGRELWLERGGRLTYEDYLVIARTQVEWEEQAARAARHVTFGDSSPLTTLLYCLDQFDRAEPELHALAERHYDLTLLCAPDIPFVQDGSRRDAAFRARQHALYQAELTRRGTRFVPIQGSFEARLEQARSAVRSLEPRVLPSISSPR
jgi:NadR type nicotinamide-nucleotide adenylyltransferase